MAKLTAPLFSFSAKGPLAGTLSYTTRHKRPIAESKPHPTDAKTPPQLAQRTKFQDAVAAWHLLTPAEKQDWETAARPYHMTGYAWFIRDYLLVPPAPVIIDQFIAASTDDARQDDGPGTMYLTDTTIWVRSDPDPALRYWGAHRWILAIPKDKTIITAYVKLYLPSALYDDPNINIHFQLASAPTTFTTTLHDITTRPLTAQSTPWIADAIGTGWKQSPELKTPLQELVNTYAITALVLIVRPNTDATKGLRSWSYNYNPALSANIHLEYLS